MKHFFKGLIILFAALFIINKGYGQNSQFGVVLAGLDFNGTTYVPNAAECQYYSGKGFKLIRVPFLWEKIQPTLGGALDATYLGYIDQVVAAAATYNMSVMIDMHNYLRYPSDPSTTSTSTLVTQGGPTQAQFNDVWTKIATHYANNTTIWGYDLMNEPHNLGSANWPAIAQSVVTAIRAVDMNHVIVLEGDHWSQGHLWPTLSNSTGLASISDPANNLVFEAHQYFDSDESGQYASTSFSGNTPLGSANTVTSGVTLIQPFVQWIQQNGLRGMVGEYGIPNNASASDQTNWNSLLDNFLSYLSTNCILGTYWAGGPGWGNGYVISCEPLNNNYTTASDERPQMATMAKYTSFATGCTPISGGTPNPVSVSITSPSSTAQLVLGSNVTITATASTTSGSITQVAFYNGTTLIGTATNSPYSITWTPTASGSYSISAVATSSESKTATSVVTVNVLEPVYKTNTAPSIDGTAEALWNSYPASNITNVTQGTVSSSTNLSANWKATWDAANLYVLVTVTDNILVNSNQSSVYNDDGIEIYIDIGNTKTTTYGSNQFQYQFRWNDTKVYSSGGNSTTGIKLGQTSQGITGGCTNNCAATGYTMEVSIPWSTLGTTAPANGTLEGFDVAVNDDDTGTRNAKIDWSSTTDNDYQDPALFGTVIMEPSPCTPPAATITAGGPTSFCPGGSVALSANTGTGNTYQWFNGGTSINGATNSTYTANTSGTYTVAVTNNNCTGTSSGTTVTIITVTPSITAGGPTSFDAGGSVVLSANTGTGITYQWNNNGSAIGGATASTYTATTSGTYTVTETVSGCSGTSSGIVVNVKNVLVTITSPSNNTTEAGGSVTLTATATANGSTVTQVAFYANGTLIGTATNSPYTITWTNASSGTYQITAIATDAKSEVDTSAAITLTLIEPIYSTTAAPVIDGIAEALWNNYPASSLNNVIVGTVSSPSNISANWKATWDASNVYVLVTVTDNKLVDNMQSGIYNDDGIEIYFDLGNTKTTSYGSNQFQFAFRWNDATIYELQHNTTTGVKMAQTSQGVTGGCTNNCAAQGYTIEVSIPWTTLTATKAPAIGALEGFDVMVNDDDSGSRDTKISWNATTDNAWQNPSLMGTVIMEGTPCTPPTAAISPSGTTSFCTGGNIKLTASSGTGYTYQWNNGGTAISGATSSTYTATAAGTYTVTVTSGGCTTTSSPTTVTVNPLPAATITPASSTTICSGSSVVLNANTGAGLTYQWNNGGTAISGATTSGYTATAAGSYTVTVANANNCTATSSSAVVTVNPLPTASITPATSTTFCSGGSVVLNANTGAGLTYQWNNSSGIISGATTSSYTATAASNYTVKVINSNNCSATSGAASVTVNPLPTATITPATSATFCSGGSVVLNANTGAGLTYQWNNSAGTINGATTSSYTATAAGNYKVTVTNANNCSATSGAASVTVNPLPTASITPASSTTFCSGGSVVLSANTGVGLTYQWNSSAGAISGATAPSYTATIADNYSVTVTNSNNCSATSGATPVTVNPLPTASITPATSTNFCTGGSVVLKANTGAGLTYQWNNSSGAISGATAANYTATAAGSYIVKVTNANNCSATSSATTVTVNSLPVATVTPATSTTFCAGGNVILNANAGTGLTYQWSNSSGAISGATSASYTATMADSYTVTVTNASNCSATSTSATVTVNTPPSPSITLGSSGSFCSGGNVILNANTGTGLTYQWNNGGNPISGATSASYITTSSGTYTVTETNSNNCTATSSATTVTVNSNPTATVTPSGSTTFCTGGNVVLNTNTGTGLTYQWSKGANTISGATTSSYTATTSGTYTVTITDASSSCSATSSGTVVNVNTLPSASITPASSTTFCSGNSVVLNANTGTGLTYKWNNSNGIISGATSASYTATATGSYTVTVTNANSCSATSSVSLVTVNPLPTAAITPVSATTFCSGGSVVLNANTGTGLTYQWNNTSGAISGATTASYTATTGGNYSVKVTNANNCSATSSVTAVTVNPSPAATVTPASATTFCSGGSVVLNANTGTGLTYQWSNSGGTIIGASSASYTATISENYSVKVTNANNCSATSSTTAVNVDTPPTTANAGTTQYITSPTATLAANNLVIGVGSWSVISGTASFTNPSSPTTQATGLSNGENVLEWTISNGTCPSSSSTVTINVGASVNSQLIAGPSTVTADQTGVSYSVTSDAGSTYHWTVPPGASIVSANTDSSSIVVNFDNTSGNITVTETNPYGSATSTLPVTVGNNPPPQQIAGPTSVTAGSTSITYSVTPDAGSSYQWSVPSGATIVSSSSDGSQITVSFGSSGGTVSVTETNSFGSTTNTLPVAVGTAPANQSISGPGSVSSGETGVTYSVSSVAGTTYHWTLPPGATITSSNTDSSQVTIDFGTSSGTVAVTATNAFGNTTDSVQVNVSGATGVIIANTVDSYEIFPNPFSETTTIIINSPVNEKITLTIIDVQGVICYSSPDYYTNQQISIGGQLASAGVYFVQVSYGNTVKVIKAVKVD